MASRNLVFNLQKDAKWDSELKRLKATPKSIERAIRDELKTTAVFIRNHIIRSMRKTPRITRLKSRSNSNALNPSGNFNWMSGGKLHIPSSPGYAPAVDTGDLIKSIKMDVRINEIEVGSNLTGKKGKYPVFLEYGTKNMEARPWLGPAVDAGEREFYATIRARVINAIRHPR